MDSAQQPTSLKPKLGKQNKRVNKVPGPIKPGDSHRCKISGIYPIIVIIKQICKLHKINKGSITTSCDNLQSLTVFNPEYTPSSKDSNFNLVLACWSLKNSVPITWHTEHILGHQDKTQSLKSLSRKSQLDVKMDHTAKTYWRLEQIWQSIHTTYRRKGSTRLLNRG
jgi:hypothetical protein